MLISNILILPSYSMFRDRDNICCELEKVRKILVEQEAREALVKEHLEKSIKEVS